MCAIIGYIGNPNLSLLNKLIEESSIRGLHNFGTYTGNHIGMFHWRYITSGETNQPIKKDNKVLIFNGVIDMGTKEEMEIKYDCNLETDNDGELIFTLCKDIESVISFIDNQKITFAGLILWDNKLYAIRNNGRPLWMTELSGTTYLASTKDIFNRSGIHSYEQLQPLKIYEWTI
jgi:asparagine synthetase B (glutamine-hydrolysing)